MKTLLRAIVVLAVLLTGGVALAGSTTPPSVGGAMAEMGCSPEPSQSALDGDACLTLAQAIFKYQRNAAIVDQASVEMELAQQDIQSELEGLTGQLSELESLRMQMVMDRYAKLMQTLSNLIKSISDTQTAITQNMK